MNGDVLLLKNNVRPLHVISMQISLGKSFEIRINKILLSLIYITFICLYYNPISFIFLLIDNILYCVFVNAIYQCDYL